MLLELDLSIAVDATVLTRIRGTCEGIWITSAVCHLSLLAPSAVTEHGRRLFSSSTSTEFMVWTRLSSRRAGLVTVISAHSVPT